MLRLFAIHQTTTCLQLTNNLNPRTRWYPVLDDSNQMKSTYSTIHPGINLPPQNGCRLKSVFFITSSTFPIQPDFSQLQQAAITLNTGSPRTLCCSSLHLQHLGQGDFWALLVKFPVFRSPTIHILWPFHFFFASLRYMSIDSLTMITYSPDHLNFHRLFLKLNWFICK